jgi:hypothetical protein
LSNATETHNSIIRLSFISLNLRHRDKLFYQEANGLRSFLLNSYNISNKGGAELKSTTGKGTIWGTCPIKIDPGD